MTKKNSLQDSLNTLKPIFDFWNSLFQIVRSKLDFSPDFDRDDPFNFENEDSEPTFFFR